MIEVGSVTRWVVIAFFIMVMGLCYVFLKNHLHTTGGQIEGLKMELAQLTLENDLLQTRINKFSSEKNLQGNLDRNFIKMIPIAEDRIVRIRATASRTAGEIHAVSNEGPAE